MFYRFKRSLFRFKNDFEGKLAGEKLKWSAGFGLRVVMNENFVIAFDLGKAIKDQDGGIGFYMGLNYLF